MMPLSDKSFMEPQASMQGRPCRPACCHSLTPSRCRGRVSGSSFRDGRRMRSIVWLAGRAVLGNANSKPIRERIPRHRGLNQDSTQHRLFKKLRCFYSCVPQTPHKHSWIAAAAEQAHRTPCPYQALCPSEEPAEASGWLGRARLWQIYDHRCRHIMLRGKLSAGRAFLSFPARRLSQPSPSLRCTVSLGSGLQLLQPIPEE